MKNSKLNLTAVVVLTFTLMLSGLAFGQMDGTQYKASIPFSFQVGDKILPAGNYIVKVSDHFIQVRDANGTNGAGIVTLRTDRKSAGDVNVMVFNLYGNQHFLANLWFEGKAEGRRVVMSRAEQEIAKQVGETKVELALGSK
ncbi:MAG TPA: hypothetical protein VF135_06965 [Terriglobales bacterium]